MGLFGKLFGKKESESAPGMPGNAPPHEEDWEFYLSNVNDIIGSLYLDLSLRTIAPIPGKPHLIWIAVNMNDPREDGLSSSEEFEALAAIEDRLHEHMIGKHHAIYAGRLTTDGRRDFYFYAADATFYEQTVSESMVAFPAYSFEFGMKEDTAWDHYLNFMYPEPNQFQEIQNRKVVNELKKAGDPLTEARLVDHWIYFRTDHDRAEFLTRVAPLQFQIVSAEKSKASGTFPYQLHLARVDKVDQDSVDEYVLALWELAQECNGDYDGWETLVKAP